MKQDIRKVAVLGAGTMGTGIAAACAEAGCEVVLFDQTRQQAERAIGRMTGGRSPIVDDPAAVARIRPAALPDELDAIGDADWVCEAIIEDLKEKQVLLELVERHRRAGSIVSTNTSGIPLRAIIERAGADLRRDIAVTHFFNPVKVMRLVELVPGEDTAPAVIERLETFLAERLRKGVVHAKDTVNFIGNRIGCFWMLAGLHKAGTRVLRRELDMETVDALLGDPLGIPATGLYGLIDLIGLDVMDLVARNLAANLPERDPGRNFTSLPEPEAAMLARGQLGRKTGGGFYRLIRHADGSRTRETFDLADQEWRATREVGLAPGHANAPDLIFADDPAGRLVWDLTSATFAYAADLVPEISDDIVNIDRALRWGFNWKQGPFELMDRIGPERIAARLEAERRQLPGMLRVLQDAGEPAFYRAAGAEQLGPDGRFHPTG